MKVKNGIIIDGVLHELVETKRNDCLKCSLRNLCQDEFGKGRLCWINLASESEITNTEFRCRGKVTVTLLHEEPKSVGEIYRNGVKIDKEEQDEKV